MTAADRVGHPAVAPESRSLVAVRSISAAVLTLLAVVGMVCALPTMWAKERLVDSDGFTSMTAPLAKRHDVQQLIADELSTQIAANVGNKVPTAVIHPVATRYTQSDQFPQDFAEVTRQEHDWLFNSPGAGTGPGTIMSVDLTNMANRLVQSFGLQVQIPGRITVPLSDSARSGLEAGRYKKLGDRTKQIAAISLSVTLIAALGALLVARRRGLVLVSLGVGMIVAGVVSWVSGAAVKGRAADEVSGAASAPKQLAQVIINHAMADLQRWVYITGAVGIAVIAVGVLVSLTLDRSVNSRY